MLAHHFPQEVEIQFSGELRAFLLELSQRLGQGFSRRAPIRITDQHQFARDRAFASVAVDHDRLIGLLAHQ